MIVEWNAHMFSADTERYPIHPRASYRPTGRLVSADPAGDYLARMDGAGIDRAVLVHPEPYGDDHRLVLDCLARDRRRLLGTCLFYPDDADAPRKLTDLIQRERRIVALRFHAHRGKEQYLGSFADAGVRALWERAGELGLIVELHIGPDYAAQVEEAVRAYPAVPVLIDHLAEPKMGTAPEYADVLALGGYPNVTMKLSGLNHFAGDAPLYPSAGRFTRLVADHFPAERLVWGSGTPEIVDAHLGHLPEEARAAVKGGNLARMLPWEAP